uniref:Peptidase C1A papain C-terminal domain-containing protein n=1 Tax=viral metagenome TaxID=1070528 RepID=A0A6C0KGS6_9ZZZZ
MNRFLISGSSFIDPIRNVHSTNMVSIASLLSSGKHIKQIYRLVSEKPKRQYNLIVSRISKENIDQLSIKKPHPQHKHMMSIHSSTTTSFQKVDLRSKFPPPFDQGSLGSCTANALCGVIAYDMPGFIGSRLFLYYNERYIEKDVKDDGGAMLSDGVESLKIYGICPESDWKYDISKFSVKPSKKCYQDAVSHHSVNVKNINNTMKDMKNALSNGYPFVVGITIYESFESDEVAKTGMVPMPSSSETCNGGHAVVCVGYDDEKQVWIMRNSWGSKWGDGGYFYLPYAYLLSDDLATDLWCVTKME